MREGLREFLRQSLPYPVRRWLSRVRDIRGPADLFGRLYAGGLQSYISHRATARRWRHVRVGRSSTIESGTHFHTNDDGDGERILIGDNCFIGQNCFFSAGSLIELRQHCVVGASCNLLAAGHEYHCATRSYGSAPVLSYGSMTLGANTWVGVGTTLVGDVQVGFGSVVAAGSLLRMALPPLCLAAGSPARILKLFDWPTKAWIRLSDDADSRSAALARHLAALPSESEYVGQLTT